MALLFSVVVSASAMLPSPPEWGKTHEKYYIYVLVQTFRFSVANSIGAFIGINIDSYFVAKWKNKLSGRFFADRSIGSSTIGELVTSIIADHLAFLGTMPYHTLLSIMISIYFIKVAASFVYAPVVNLIASHLKEKYKLDVYEPNVKLNPFSMK